MNAGFYKLDGSLLHAANWIHAPSYELYADQKDTYTYPVDGWYWFDTLEEACLHFNLNIQDYLS
jgi:hypothetical protein